MSIRPPPGWEPPRRTLIIASTLRSGSNLFCDKLTSTGVLGRPTEYFRHWDTPEITTAARCMLAAEKGRTDNGVVAFKLFPDHFDRLQEDIRLLEWFPDPLWVYLERRDLLGQAISLAKAMQDGVWRRGENAALGDAEYSATRIEAALATITAGQGRWAAYFAGTGVEPLRFVYEDILGDFDNVCQRIGCSLALQGPVPPTMEAQSGQQRNAQNDEWRRKFLAEADRSHFPAALPARRKKRKWVFWKKSAPRP